MSGVVIVTNRDRGFARLGPNSDAYFRGIAGAMEQVGYERKVQGGDIWMRGGIARVKENAGIASWHPGNEQLTFRSVTAR